MDTIDNTLEARPHAHVGRVKDWAIDFKFRGRDGAYHNATVEFDSEAEAWDWVALMRGAGAVVMFTEAAMR